MHRILVVDDDPLGTRLLAFLFSDEGFDVTAVHSASAALGALSNSAYDLIMLDVMMPGMDGLELCRCIRLKSTTPIIFVSARMEVKDKVTGLDAGADDYITKPYEPNELLARVWVILRRNDPRTNTLSQIKTPDIVLDLVHNTATLARNGEKVELTHMETRLLRCLLTNLDCNLSRETILKDVWGANWPGKGSSLDVYVKRLRDKIEEDLNEPRLLLTVRGTGYRFQSSILPDRARAKSRRAA